MSLNDKWELSVVENAGEIDSKNFTDAVEVSTRQLLIDIKSQLMFTPKNFNYTIGWRAIVWKEKETGQFKDLTEEEHRAFLERGTAQFTGGDSTDGGEGGDSTGDEGVST